MEYRIHDTGVRHGIVLVMAGGFLDVCYNEYFNDQTKHRNPIVTGYRF